MCWLKELRHTHFASLCACTYGNATSGGNTRNKWFARATADQSRDNNLYLLWYYENKCQVLGAILSHPVTVLGHLGIILGPSWDILGCLRAVQAQLSTILAGIGPGIYFNKMRAGPLRESQAILEPRWVMLEPSRDHHGAILGRLGHILGSLGAIKGHLKPSWDTVL